MKLIGGKAFVLGDRIDTDLLAPGAHMRKPIEELKWHCLEAVDPEFARRVKAGDVLIAGRGFGIGSSREQAAQALKELGIGCVVARSFARIFYRNALNLGLPVLVCEEDFSVRAGDDVEVDIRAGVLRNCTQGHFARAQPMPDFLIAMLDAGGLLPQLKLKLAQRLRSPC